MRHDIRAVQTAALVAILSILVIFLIALPGCQSVGGPVQPQNVSESIDISYALVLTTAKSAKEAHDVGTLSDAQAADIQSRLTSALEALDLAERARLGSLTTDPNMPQAQQYLLMANATLNAVIEILDAHTHVHEQVVPPKTGG